MNYKRILHVRVIAGVASTLARVQRTLGYNSDVFDYYDRPGWPGFPTDLNTNLPTECGKLDKGLRWVSFVLGHRLCSHYDVYHLHFGTSLLPFNLDIPLLKAMGKRVIVHYHGSEVRGRKQPVLMKTFANTRLVSTPDLLAYVPDATWIPNPIDIQGCAKYNGNTRPSEPAIIHIVAHGSSRPELKGVPYTLDTIGQLQKQGYAIKFTLIDNKPHSEVMGILSQADIVIDQLAMKAGWYGIFACEAMAMKKPVCVYIDDILESKYLPSKPVVNVNPWTLPEKLKELIGSPALRTEMGERGYKYVTDVHDQMKVTRKVLDTCGI